MVSVRKLKELKESLIQNFQLNSLAAMETKWCE